MATLIFSLIFSFIPAIMIGKAGIGFGYAFLTYIFGVIFSFVGAKIGKIVRDFVGEIFISSTGGIVRNSNLIFYYRTALGSDAV